MTTFGRSSNESSASSQPANFSPTGKLPFLITVLAGVACYAIFFRRGLGLSVIGYSISPSERVMNGEVPYRDFLFNYTPGILWVNALLMKAFGPTLLTIRAGLLLFKVLSLVMLFIVARRLTCAWAALVPVSLTLAWLGHRQVFNVYPDQYLILFALLAISFMLSHDASGKAHWLFSCGVATGAVFLFKHNVGLFLLVAAMASISIREISCAGSARFSRIARKSATNLLGFLIVIGALVAYLVYHHALGAMIDHFLHHAVEYSESRAVGLPGPAQLQRAALASLITIAAGVLVFYRAPKLFSSYLLAVLLVGAAVLVIPGRAYAFKESAVASVAYFPVVVFAASLFAALIQIRKTIKSKAELAAWWQTNGAIVIAGLFALAVYLEVLPRADSYHLVRVLPVVMLFFFALVRRSISPMKGFFEGRLQKPPVAAFMVAAVPLCLLLLIGILDCWAPQFDAKLHLKDKAALSIERGRGILVEKRQAELAEGLVRLIEENSAAADPIFSFSQRGSSLYFLANRKNPSRLLWWSSVGIRQEERDAVLNMVRAGIPKLVVIQDIPGNKTMRDFIGSYYNHVGTVSDIAVFRRVQ